MQTLRTSGYLMAILPLLSLSAAAAAPIRLTWDYGSAVQSYVYAKAKNKDASDTKSDSKPNAPASVTAHASVINGQDNQDSYMTASAAASEDGNGLKINSATRFTCSGRGTIHAQGNASAAFSATLMIGTSDVFPAGAGGLTLTTAAALMADSAGWNSKSWSLKVFDQQGGTLLATLQAGNLQQSLPVKAGSSVYVALVHDVDSGDKNVNSDISHNLDVSFSIIPEPMTLAIFSLGLLLPLRRR